MDEFVEWLVVNHTQQGIAQSRHTYQEQKAIKNAELDSRIQLLSSIEGVSVNQAEALLEKFGSIPNILRVKRTQRELMEINGINRRKAKAILNLRKNYELVEK